MEWVLPPPKLVCKLTTGSPPWPFSRSRALCSNRLNPPVR